MLECSSQVVLVTNSNMISNSFRINICRSIVEIENLQIPMFCV